MFFVGESCCQKETDKSGFLSLMLGSEWACTWASYSLSLADLRICWAAQAKGISRTASAYLWKLRHLPICEFKWLRQSRRRSGMLWFLFFTTRRVIADTSLECSVSSLGPLHVRSIYRLLLLLLLLLLLPEIGSGTLSHDASSCRPSYAGCSCLFDLGTVFRWHVHQ